MANSKVKFLQNSAGSYGMALTNDEAVVSNAVAKELEKNGVVKIIGDAGDEEETVPVKGSVRFNDQTGTTANAAGETDPKNPTGKDKPVAKAAPLKSAKKKR